MPDNIDNSGRSPADEGSEYLQIFLDETEEQLDDLVETLLVLERDPESTEDLNEAFRLIHSIKGAAGMMGFDSISVLTHHLENRFEQFRAGRQTIDQPTMNVVLRCIDFLRECNRRLGVGQQLSNAPELLAELKELESQPEEPIGARGQEKGFPDVDPNDEGSNDEGSNDEGSNDEGSNDEAQPSRELASSTGAEESLGGLAPPSLAGPRVQLTVTFESGLKLADLKARLILSRLSSLGEIALTQPAMDDIESIEELAGFSVVLDTEASEEEIREAADVDGVRSITFGADLAAREEAAAESKTSESETPAETLSPAEPDTGPKSPDDPIASDPSPDDSIAEQPQSRTDEPAGDLKTEVGKTGDGKPDDRKAGERPTSKASPTMRVDIDRLDNLMNLAGELVVNRAQFMQASQGVRPALRKSNVANRSREFGDSLRRMVEELRRLGEINAIQFNGDWAARIQELEAGAELLEEQAEFWDRTRRCFGEIDEAIDRLTQVSDGLRRGVLGTRMVPVGPLFNRFKRVVRDLSMDRNKKVNLQIHGEKTELDKRMIDQLGDPLVHLVRNCIDHGLEPTQVRLENGKPEVGEVLLEASHSGNNVYVRIQDDGGGIDINKIKTRLIQNKILSGSAIDDLSDEEIIEYIWHPGFSTAAEITNVSGRGVGMDVVQTRIAELNGSVDVETVLGVRTTFTIRLPLTLAIVSSLLARIDDVIFSMPIDDVREIVSVQRSEIVAIRGNQAFDVRGEFVPLVDVNDIFDWNMLSSRPDALEPQVLRESERDQSLDVVILYSKGKTLGLKVDELLGGQDIVIKSLSENLMHIRGLSGATVLGDGTVSLMLDVETLIEMAIFASPRSKNERRSED